MESLRDQDGGAGLYAEAEETFLAAIRADQDRTTLTALANNVAAQAKAWNARAYSAYHSAKDVERESLDHVTERTEVLEHLWSDIAGAFHGRSAARDG